MKFLKNHPFPVEAYFNNSTVLTFAVPKEELESFIPECLSLDTFNDKWAFLAIAMVQTSNLRPAGFPKFLGQDFFLIGYRIFVRFINSKGKNLRGLYILKSETDKKKMEFLGNIFTKYSYETTDVKETFSENIRTIESGKSKFRISIDITEDEVKLPSFSPFSEWSEARKFSGPLPHTFTYDEKRQEVLIIRGLRQNWKPQPLNIIKYNFDFLEKLKLNKVVLASAFEVKDIPYHWEKGKIEKWQKSENHTQEF